MASGRIKGITIEIGGNTTKLDKALAGTDKQLKQTQTSLKDIERLLKLDPGNVELMVQKQRLLTDAVEGTADRLRTLKDAAQQAEQALTRGEISQGQFDALNREIVETQINLEKLTQEANNFDIDAAVQGAENRLNDLSGAAENAGGSLDGLSDSSGGLSGGLSSLGGIAGGVSVAIGQKLVEAAMAAVEWLWSLDEATEEYREAMGKLNTAFETAGYGPEAAKEAYEGFFKILGDTDTATEASQLLAQLANSEEDLSKWTEIAAGVYGSFGDALPIEGLIEAANETAKTGKVTGVLADALNWVGMSEDQFNEALSKTSDEGQRAQLIMNNLGVAYQDAANAFYQNNEALMESREVQMQLDGVQAQLGESVADLKNQFFELFGPALIGLMQGAGNGLEGIAFVVEKIGQALDWLGEKVQGVIGFFKELFGAGKQASSIPVEGGSSGSRSSRALAESYAIAATAENLPYLAQGTVTRPNSPFMAVVGDNPNEPEIISPLSTIEQAVRNVIGSGGGMPAKIQVSVNFTGTWAQFVRQLQPQITVEAVRLGPQFVK